MKSRKLLESCSCFHSSNQIPAFRRAHGSDKVLAASFICSAKKHLHCFLLLGIGRVNSHRSSRCILFRRAVLSLVSVLLTYSVNISMQEIVCSVVLYIYHLRCIIIILSRWEALSKLVLLFQGNTSVPVAHERLSQLVLAANIKTKIPKRDLSGG